MSKSICWKVVSSNCTKSLPDAWKGNCPQLNKKPPNHLLPSNSDAFFFFVSWTCTRHVYLILQCIMPQWSPKRASSVHFWSGPSKILTFANAAGGTVVVSKCSKSLSACFTKNLTTDRTELASPNWQLKSLWSHSVSFTNLNDGKARFSDIINGRREESIWHSGLELVNTC